MKVLLVGSCGYVGSMIYDNLSKDLKFDIVCIDPSDEDIYPKHIQKKAHELSCEEISVYNTIIWVAGLSRKEDNESISKELLYKLNVEEFELFVKKMLPEQLLIYSSTASLYINKDDNTLLTEEAQINTDIFGNYENIMLFRENVINKLHKKTVALRFGTVIGISHNMRPELLYNGLYLSAFTSKSLNIFNQNARRSILWFEDLCNSLKLIIQYKNKIEENSIFNLSSFNTTVIDAAKYIADNTGSKINIIRDTNNYGFFVDNSLFSRTFNYKFIGTPQRIHEIYSSNKDYLLEQMNNPKNRHMKCLICNSILLESIIDLGEQPLANYFIDDTINVEKYPLHLYRCMICNHTQLNYLVNREILFKNYIYESGTSKTLRDYFSQLAERYTSLLKESNKTILELACNDGFQLDEFKKRGWKTYGVDPAINIVEKCIAKGHTVECKFWGKEKIEKISNINFDLIVAQNVLAHVNNPITFLKECYNYMNENTLLVIQTSQANIFTSNQFDTIYHEHISFFTIKSMKRAVESIGCYLDNVYKTDIHGVSYVFEIRKGIFKKQLPLLEEEINQGLYTNEIYQEYKMNIQLCKIKCLETIKEYKNKEYKIMGFGAAAKGNVFLNYIFDSQPNILAPEYLIDNSTAKHHKYTSGTNIKVKNEDIILEYNNSNILMIILAWNFYDEIVKRLQLFINTNNLNINMTIIRFFPDCFINHIN